MAKTLSGKFVVKILCRTFGFSFVSQSGSHVKLRKVIAGRTVTTIVPLHRELAKGTVHGVLELAEVDEKIFWKEV